MSEDAVFVELCAIVYQPTGLACPIDLEFDVTLSTDDSTASTAFNRERVESNYFFIQTYSAGSPMDYLSLSQVLVFQPCDTRQCVNVSIVDDSVLEETEFFNATLASNAGLDPRITLNPVTAVVNILDNDGRDQTL